MTTRKKRGFDIAMPEEKLTAAEPRIHVIGEGRRSPMATAIGEAAGALDARQATEAKIRIENDALAHEHVRLKKMGLILDLIPLEKILTTKLVRDRHTPDAGADLDDLKTSIREVGLSNPIRVEATDDGHYELIQGFRRLSAYRALHAETGDAAYATIPAGLLPRGEDTEALYRRMVDENLVRKDISFAEMAILAAAYAADPDTSPTQADEAVAILYKSAGYQKRSYIRAFTEVMAHIGALLAHPEAIPRSLGLDLRRRMEAEPKAIASLQAQLKKTLGDRSAEDEVALLRAWSDATLSPSAPSKMARKAQGRTSKPAAAAHQFSVAVPGGDIRCTMNDGGITLRGAGDFSAHSEADLKAAVEAFARALLP